MVRRFEVSKLGCLMAWNMDVVSVEWLLLAGQVSQSA